MELPFLSFFVVFIPPLPPEPSDCRVNECSCVFLRPHEHFFNEGDSFREESRSARKERNPLLVRVVTYDPFDKTARA